MMKHNKMEKYERVDKLGEGTYGVVYKVYSRYMLSIDHETKQHHALKKIRLESDEEGIPSTAIREISILKELDHPNIVNLEEIIHTNRKLILVFEFIEYDLKKFMSKHKEKGLDSTIIKVNFILFRVSAINFCWEFNIVMGKRFFIEILNLKIYSFPTIIDSKLQTLDLLGLLAFQPKVILIKS